ncbi:protein SENESCENCE-ASSOCIATED GENE 21, mitochondrial-like [Henckelia pumila]|uniref:protein SENESCENCE-ASSOCIATED GENE 21, mitochondrial-like n=1 Tax=Henckelia pumila TaxID=405737 RepID=UPI003C6DFBC1
MAPSFSNVKTLSAFISNKISAQGTVSRAVRLMLKNESEEPTKISWIPDPVTGYYRPENKAQEIDAAELRRILIKPRTRRHLLFNWWIPDPVTGYYRPENKAQEIDAAELRRILIKPRTRRHL